MVQCRRFTCTFYSDTAIPFTQEMSYLVQQQEICPSTKRPHWQVYFELKVKTEFKTVMKPIEGHGKLFISKGTAYENYKYCSKNETSVPNTFQEHGKAMKQGQRNDLVQYKDAVIDGMSQQDLLDEFPSVVARYTHFRDTIHAIQLTEYSKKPRNDLIVEFVFGPPGTGKSHYAHSHDDYYKPLLANNTVWFEQYAGEKVLLLEDLDPSTIPRHNLLTITDKYPMRLPIKGSSTWAAWNKVIITTNCDISDFTQALRRRVRLVPYLIPYVQPP